MPAGRPEWEPRRWELLFCAPWRHRPLADRLRWAKAIHEEELARGPARRTRAGPGLLAARDGDARMIEGLARLGVSFEPEPGAGKRSSAPLFEAVKLPGARQRAMAVEALARQGARLRPFPNRASALTLAVVRGSASAIEGLARAGVDLNNTALWDHGRSPLALAISLRGLAAPVVKALLEGGARADHELPGARTPLACAARAGLRDCAALLIAAGADPLAQAEDGQDALDMALRDARYGEASCGLAALDLIQAKAPGAERRRALIQSLREVSEEGAEAVAPALRALEALEQADALARAIGGASVDEAAQARRPPRFI